MSHINFAGANHYHMLSTGNLKFQYTGGASFDFPDIMCGKGEHLLVLGESGRGKTTLLHLLAGMLRPQRGQVVINGTDTAGLSGSDLDRFRGANIGIVFQTAHFIEALNVEDNLIMPQYLSGQKISTEKAHAILKRLNLANRHKEMPSQLSVGEQQRVAIARAVMNDPAIILADEPTSALDDRNADEVIALLEDQARLTGAGLIIVTHDKRLKDRFNKQVAL